MQVLLFIVLAHRESLGITRTDLDILILVLLPQDLDCVGHLAHLLLLLLFNLAPLLLNHQTLHLLDRGRILHLLQIKFLALELASEYVLDDL